MKYQYIFHARVPRFNKLGEPVIDPETDLPIYEEHPIVLIDAPTLNRKILTYNNKKNRAAHLFNSKQGFTAWLKRTKQYFNEVFGPNSYPAWIKEGNFIDTRIMRNNEVLEMNVARSRRASRKAKEIAKRIVEEKMNE